MSVGFRCPECRSENSDVFDSRPGDDGGYLRRRRRCTICGARWTTREVFWSLKAAAGGDVAHARAWAIMRRMRAIVYEELGLSEPAQEPEETQSEDV
jgi:hypothetical protein